MPQHPSATAAMTAVASHLGIGSVETRRKWVNRAEIDVGERLLGVTSEEHAEIKRLRRENFELPRANEILRGSGARPPATTAIRYIDEHKAEHGVEPICHTLTANGVKIAPSS